MGGISSITLQSFAGNHQCWGVAQICCDINACLDYVSCLFMQWLEYFDRHAVKCIVCSAVVVCTELSNWTIFVLVFYITKTYKLAF